MGAMMKKLLLPFVLCLIVISTSFGQSSRNDYKKIDYIKVDQEYLDQFVQLAEEQLKPKVSSLIESNSFLSWSLYKVQYPGGKESGYNFVSVTTASSIDTFSEQFASVTAPDYVPESVGTNGQNQFGNISSVMKSEIWKVENNIEADSLSGPSKFMTMDYMNVAPGKSPDYLMLEDEIAKPIHIERIEDSQMDDWAVYSLILPGGINYGYNYATGNHFEKLGHVEFGFNDEIIKQAIGENSNIPELFNTIYTTRDLVKRELWQLVDHVQ